ncbi:MAG: TrgA family protein [Paracoccaceae bacterium]
MFTLIRPIAAVMMMIVAYYGAVLYIPISFEPGLARGMPPYTAMVGFVVGWLFLGGMLKRQLWFSIFAGLQAGVMTAILASLVLTIPRIWTIIMRGRYREVTDAVRGYVELNMDWLMRALNPDLLIPMGIACAIVGAVLHFINRGLDARRNDR